MGTGACEALSVVVDSQCCVCFFQPLILRDNELTINIVPFLAISKPPHNNPQILLSQHPIIANQLLISPGKQIAQVGIYFHNLSIATNFLRQDASWKT